MKYGLFVTSGLALALFSGCALKTDEITLQYKPQENIKPLAEAKNVTVGLNFIDSRQDKSKVGVKKNGYGMEMAPIVNTEDVSGLVKKAVEEELANRGFRLDKDGIVQISADMTRFYNDFKLGFTSGDSIADFYMNITVKSKTGSVIYVKQIMTQGKEPGIMIMSGDNAKLALDRALASGIKSLFDDEAFVSALVTAKK